MDTQDSVNLSSSSQSIHMLHTEKGRQRKLVIVFEFDLMLCGTPEY